ncbi:DNA-directed RNA polymerase sigma subunit (sigma70/sigma32) [Arthrobacter sp. CAN_A212]|uniref:sigma factor-like helix-turn-helix DNA-binding protein n=1 Tax=Arthrobacter sp. CAN_A212 TaxID=2787719 RepID=UPI0018C9005B
MSLNINIPDGPYDYQPLYEALFDPSDQGADASAFYVDLQDTVGRALGTLPERSAHIPAMRYGFAGQDPHTLEECGAVLGVTRERIRHLEVKAIAELRLIAEFMAESVAAKQ